MWYEAAELIWASILGYFTLPQPDKKGIATSLGILADIFVSMSENDYIRFKNNDEFDLNIRGTCLLSYSCSSACPSEKQKFYLSEAKESFEIGLLSKKDKETVTSKQELHSFIKAAFCLTKVHQRLYGESERLSQVNHLCQQALQKLYAYSHSRPTEEQDKEQLAKDIMCLVMSVKEQLHVQNFPNSDAKSYIPESYKAGVRKQIVNGELSFQKVLKMHSQHHAAICEVHRSVCQSHKMSSEGKTGACITTLKTETKSMDTMGTTEESSHCRKDTAGISVSQKGRRSREGFKGQKQKKLFHVAVIGTSRDEDTEGVSSEMSGSCADGISKHSHSRSKSSSLCRSWSKLSKSNSFTSWEEIDYNDNELPQDKEQKSEDVADKEQNCSADVTQDAEENIQKHDLHLLASKTQQLSLQEAQNDCSCPLQHPFQNIIALSSRETESYPNPNKEHMEGTENASEQPLRKTSSTKPKNDTLNDVVSPTSEQDPLEMFMPSSLMDSRTKDSTKDSCAISSHNLYNVKKGSTEDLESCKQVAESVSRSEWPFVELETVDYTEDARIDSHTPGDSRMLKHDHFVQNWINQSISPAPAGVSSGISGVDSKAETAEDWEFASNSIWKSVDPLNDMCVMKEQPQDLSENSNSASGRNSKQSVNQSSDCPTTEEDEDEKLRNILNSSHSSSSSLKSWYKASQFSSSFSELGSPSFLNSSGSSFVLMDKIREQTLQARILSDDDYDKLLSGVKHNWLMERMKNTGLFKPKLLSTVHSALLLKYSKNSGLWTAQETAVYTGNYLKVAKPGQQRNAFWIHFLHQEETLGRYVGKEYKDEKELLHHFSDVERQMTAQHYVTEFNKRLYEQKIPTQIFYIPSAILLILEGKAIQGCISVEPYILGEFVKLSNNTDIVKLEYKATEYGLAYGHFCYEFSQGTDVVVDLQGWVTGNGKGLIYLTDPQIHSLSQKDASCLINFGKKGIYYFFNNQHKECNEICRHLSLTRPSVEKPN